MRSDLLSPFQQHLRHRGILGRGHQESAVLDDPGLLQRDVLECVPEHLRVIQVHGRHDGHRGIGHVGGVPAAADAHFQDHDVHRFVREDRERQNGEHLEVREPGLATLRQFGVHEPQVRDDFAIAAHERLIRHGLTVQADALGDPLQVGARVAAHPQVMGEEQGLDHTSGGGLAVGPGDVDDRRALLGVSQDVHGALDRVQARLHSVLRCTVEELGVHLFHGLGSREVPCVTHQFITFTVTEDSSETMTSSSRLRVSPATRSRLASTAAHVGASA